jgi:AsmA protein
MKRAIRIITGLLIAILLIIIIIISGLVLFINPNQLKPVLINEVQKKSGYELSIDGNLSWSFYPRIGIKAAAMTLRAANKKDVFLNLQNVSISSDLLALLQNRQQLLGEINIAHVLLGKINLENVHVNLQWQNQILLLKPMTGNFYGGTITGTVEGKDLSQSMSWRWQLEGKHVNIKALLKDLSDNQAKLTIAGFAQVNFQGATVGKEKQAILKNLNGSMSFNLQQGALEGIDINYLIQKVSNLIKERRLVLDQGEAALLSKQTVFKQLTGTAIIKNGILKNNDLLLVSSNFTAKAAGKINLITDKIDYKLQVLPTNVSKITWAIPIILEGNLARPKVRLDLVTLNALIAREQLEKAKTKIEENIEKLPEKAQKFLDHLLR